MWPVLKPGSNSGLRCVQFGALSLRSRTELPGTRHVKAANKEEAIMAAATKIGEKVPLAVVGKDGTTVGDDGKENTMTNDERQTAIQQLNEQLKALRDQVETLSGSLARMGNKAGRAVAHSAGTATDTVTTTVRTYPFYAVLAASAAAFVLGRLSAAPAPSAPDRAYDQLRHRLSDLASHLPPHLLNSIRSSTR
jgi:hypothetical protein